MQPTNHKFNHYEKMKRILATIIALGATALTGLSQGVPPVGSYTVNSLTLPTTIISQAVGTTNLANGWDSVTSYTNTYTAWNSSSNAFITTTNVLSTTNTVYADMPCSQQKDLAIVVSESAGIGTNVYTFAYGGLDSATVDNNRTATITIGHAAAGTATGSTNISVGGFGNVRLITETWTAASAAVTNNYIKYSVKRNAW